MSGVQIEVAIKGSARVGEGPFWDGGSGLLHWVDILSGEIRCADPLSPVERIITLPTLVGAAVPKQSGGYVAATTEGFAAVDDERSWETRVANLIPGHRMNDAKCDRDGRFWAGSTDMEFADGKGALHVLSPDWQSQQVMDGFILPNGLDWSPDGSTFYLIDSMAGEVYAFDVEPGSIELANRRILARFVEADGLPDGMTVDAEGCLWIAMWGGSQVIRLSPTGERLFTLPMPVRQPSSCAFGGPNLDVLYVTSAREGLDLSDDDAAGSVYAVYGLGVRGRPATTFGG